MTTTTTTAPDDDEPAAPRTFGQAVTAQLAGGRKAAARAFQQRLAGTGLHGKPTTTTEENE